ncbi:MAG: hypothetical protein IKP40_11695 [Clostridia bacterium]|nr:hypothetical protein [Clostridia bacterium]
MLTISPLFTDLAVLPLSRELRLFGEASAPLVTARLTSPGGVTLASGEAETVNGRYELLLPPLQPQEGLTLTVEAGGERLVSENIAVGLLLLCGGQSNMELELRNCAEGPALIPVMDDPGLRYFNVPRYARSGPEADAAFAGTRWKAVTPGQAGDMSAVACFAGRRLREATGWPVGLVDCYWGGTSATCWMDEGTLLATAEGARYLSEYRAACGDKDMAAYLEEENAFQQEMNEWNSRVEAARAHLGPDAPWAAIEAEAGICPWHPPVGPGSPYRPAGLFTTMVKPLLPLALSAVLWYQGEEDTFHTDRYDVLLLSLMRCWRKAFRQPGLPFIVAQLPCWQPDDSPEDDPRWPETRLRQAEVCAADARALCVCQIDQGEQHNIHPVHKQPIGQRLADALLTLLGRDAPVSPEITAWQTDGPALLLTVSQPLQTPAAPAKHFELRGVCGPWHPAAAEITGTAIRLTSPAVPRPTAARYAHFSWGEVNVFGVNGLPLAPGEVI